jgi:hypothetical protein
MQAWGFEKVEILLSAAVNTKTTKDHATSGTFKK